MNDDAALLRRYAEERDEDAFAELVRRHLPLVYGAALRQLDGAAHRAEEVTQSVFTDLARKAAPLAQRTELCGWLYTSTHFAAAKLKRTEQRRQLREQEAQTMHELLSPTPADVDWQRLRPVLDDAMHELDDRERELILQRFFQGRRFAEVGERLGLSEDAARMRVERALEKLRALLARRQITSTTAALAIALANQPAVAVPAGLAATVTGAALTSAKVATGSVATVLQFMTTSKIVAGVAGVALLAGSLGIATHESRARVAAENSLAAASGEVARLDGRLRDLRQRVSAAEQVLTETRANLTVAEARLAKAPPSVVATTDPIEAGKEFLARHPEARQLWKELDRANIAAQLTPVYRMMHLSQEMQDQLETVGVRSLSGVTRIATPDGYIALQREPTLTYAEGKAQAQDLLGGDGYDRLLTLSRVASTFDLTAKLASALYRTEPLNPQQTDRVMEIFANAILMAKSGHPNDPAGIDWNAISVEAGSVLSPAQLAGLTGVQRTFEYQQAMEKVSRPIPSASVAPKNSNSPSR